MKTYGIYHRVDLDGVACAAILSIAHPETILIPYQYGDDLTPIHDIPEGSTVYMMDVSLPVEEMIGLAERTDLTWIDHHRDKIVEVAARAGLWAEGEHIVIQKTISIGNGFMLCYCDTRFAGCELTLSQFKFLNGLDSEIVQGIITVLGKYDTWRVDELWVPETKPFQYAMRTLVGLDVNLMMDCLMNSQSLHAIREMGVGILKYQQQQEAIVMKTAIEGKLHFGETTYDCIAVNADGLNSDAFKDNFDCDNKILLMYSFQKGKWKIGMRATSDIDVGKICARFGGGGHPKAAGCWMDVANFYMSTKLIEFGRFDLGFKFRY